jgi:hypothetical protein
MIIKGVVKPFPQYETYTKKDGATDYKQTMLVETYGQYPKLVAMTIMGSEKITDILQKWAVGSAVDVHVNAESREYQGKYYTNLNVWKVENGSQTVAAGQGVAAGVPAQAAPMGGPVFVGQPVSGGYLPQMANAPAQVGFPMPVVPQSPFNQPQPMGSPLQQHVEQLQAQAQQQSPAAPQYQIGQIVNGYQMQPDGNWAPFQQAAPAPMPMVPVPGSAPAPIPMSPQTDPNNWNAGEIPF